MVATYICGTMPDLHDHVRAGNIVAVQQTIAVMQAANKNINFADRLGLTSLRVACHCKHPNGALILSMLLEAGCNPDAASSGRTLLHAVCNGVTDDTQKASLLLVRGCKINAKDDHGETPLHVACSDPKGSQELVLLLLNNGADIDAKSDISRTPLHLACGHVYTYGPRPSRSSIEAGWCYVQNRNSASAPLVRILLENGADRFAKTHFGTTPIDIVTDPDIVALFAPRVKGALC